MDDHGQPLSDRATEAEVAELKAVFDAVMDLALQIGMDVVVEGVETKDQARLLRRLGVRNVQGFLFGRPMPAEEALRAAGGQRHGAPPTDPAHRSDPDPGSGASVLEPGLVLPDARTASRSH